MTPAAKSGIESIWIAIMIMPGTPNSSRSAKTISTEKGDSISYETLILALGARARKVPVAGHELEGVHYLRSIRDVNNIRQELENARRLVIVGAGYIGLEVAAVTRQLGLDVTVIEMADRVMSRVVSAEVAA